MTEIDQTLTGVRVLMKIFNDEINDTKKKLDALTDYRDYLVLRRVNLSAGKRDGEEAQK